ncbi:MAG: chloride channel protein [Actinomycetes bacterium]
MHTDPSGAPSRGDRTRLTVTTGVLGFVVGAVMVGVQRLTVLGLLDRVAGAPLPLLALCPAVGLLLAALALRFVGRRASPTITDEYIRNVHDPAPLDLGPVPGRLLASMGTIGFGGALRLEGVAIYVGGAIGTLIDSRLGRRLRRDDAKVLMIAGAAAGVAAIFQTPVTGAVLALEVPFRGRLGRRHVLPVLAASVAGYLAAILIVGRRPLFPVRGHVSVEWRDLLAAIVVGFVAGALAHGLARLILLAKALGRRVPLGLRLPVAGALLAGIVLTASAITTDGSVVLGPGYEVTRWALDPTHATGVVAGMLVLRMLATSTALAGGGVGGLSIPLVAAGALTGRTLAGLVGRGDDPLGPVVGAAAFLAAGYRVPLAAITFVAETTGRAGFIAPAMLAAFAADITIGHASVSGEQRDDAEAGW